MVGEFELAIYATLFSTASRSELEEFVRAKLGPLIAQDEAKSARLLDSLRLYIAEGLSLPRAAAASDVHVNTMRQRIEKARHMLGIEDISQDLFEIQAALVLYRLMKASLCGVCAPYASCVTPDCDDIVSAASFGRFFPQRQWRRACPRGSAKRSSSNASVGAGVRRPRSSHCRSRPCRAFPPSIAPSRQDAPAFCECERAPARCGIPARARAGRARRRSAGCAV